LKKTVCNNKPKFFALFLLFGFVILLIVSLYPISNFIQAAVNENDTIAPEDSTGTTEQNLVKSEKMMVASANAYASRAGLNILEEGGSAVDAMIATQLVLNLVEPQSSGIGGGAFALYYDSDNKKLTSWDARETAPNNVSDTIFVDVKSNEAIPFYSAVVGAQSVGTPGLLKLFETLHGRYGVLPWERLFQYAINLANDGFIVSNRLAQLVKNDHGRLDKFSVARNYFYPNGKAIQEGDVLRNHEYANTLKILSTKGIKPFYNGEIAKDIVNAVKNNDNPGSLSLQDLIQYDVVKREPICVDYREYEVCGMGPPSSGGMTIAQILGMLNYYNLNQFGANDAQSLRLIGDASRLAFADRDRYISDPNFQNVPIAPLLDKKYLRERALLLLKYKSLNKVDSGRFKELNSYNNAKNQSISLPSTTHMSIVDGDGNAISLTSSIENMFGSRVMVRGFLLNNNLTDFSFLPEVDGKQVANRIQPGKRSRSSMSPTMVMNGKPVLIIGATGGSRIINYVIKTLIAYLDWKLPINEAIEIPHFVLQNDVFEIESSMYAEDMADKLKDLGYKVNIRDLNSGINAIVVKSDGMEGASDPRREGKVLGR